MMQFRFDANQDFQVDATASVVDLFDGQTRAEGYPTFTLGGVASVPNRLDLEETDLLANLRAVQARNGLPEDDALQWIEGAAETPDAAKPVRFANFSVEMETGTGKTYVYLRTALELYRRYGFRKHIIVVPSVAVREGVLKTLQVTRAHFAELSENAPYRFYAYDSANLSQVRQFALSNGVEFMVMTIDSFNKASNVIRQSTDRLQGETPIHLVQATRPILILDEPQNMESELRVKALATLDPLFALRYSATHRNPYNVVYRLTPFEAYRQRLVKRIEVAGIEQVDDDNLPFLRLDEVRTAKRTLTARIAVHKLMKDGTVKEQVITVKPGENLQAQTNRPEYAAFVVDEINYGFECVLFTNGVELPKGAVLGADKEAIFEAMIRYTVEEHFRKQARLKPLGIKVLSLFFIDRVDNYVREDGVVRRLFERCFDELKANYPDWRDVESSKAQAAYFAQRRAKSGEVVFEDSKTGEAERDRETYDLIMRDKERLLSFEEPTAFIFSHSALREGWDNPNIFQICALNQTVSEVKKRQEIGRGVRLAVNQEGERVREEHVNILTVTANESYERYVERLQSEFVEEYGEGELPPKPANARQRGTIRLRKEYVLKPEFQELWERIKHRTRYSVILDTERLIRDAVEELDKAHIGDPRIVVAKALVRAENVEDVFVAMQLSGVKTMIDLSGKYPLPDIVGVITHLLENASPPVRLGRGTLIEALRRSKRQREAVANPHGFASAAARIIKRVLDDQLVSGIRYEKTGEWYEMTLLEDSIENLLQEYLVPADRSVYDAVFCESNVEREFVEGLDARDDVRLYIKLPSWFTVPTPVGNYNPDWAIVREDRDEHGEATAKTLYLVRETKDTTNLDELRPDEARKIRCGAKHFGDALGVDYRVVTNAREL